MIGTFYSLQDKDKYCDYSLILGESYLKSFKSDLNSMPMYVFTYNFCKE